MPIGPHSKTEKISRLDGRRREGVLLRETRDLLRRHLGDKPSIAQELLIERASVLRVRLAMMDRTTLAGADMSERNANQYLAWHGAYSRTLALLGLQGAPERVEPLDVFLARQRPAVAA